MDSPKGGGRILPSLCKKKDLEKGPQIAFSHIFLKILEKHTPKISSSPARSAGMFWQFPGGSGTPPRLANALAAQSLPWHCFVSR